MKKIQHLGIIGNIGLGSTVGKMAHEAIQANEKRLMVLVADTQDPKITEILERVMQEHGLNADMIKVVGLDQIKELMSKERRPTPEEIEAALSNPLNFPYPAPKPLPEIITLKNTSSFDNQRKRYNRKKQYGKRR